MISVEGFAFTFSPINRRIFNKRYFLLVAVSVWFMSLLPAQNMPVLHKRTCHAAPNSLSQIWENSQLRGDSTFILNLSGNLELHLQKFSHHTYENGGEVIVFKTINAKASEFLLSRRNGKYYATFHRLSFQNHLWQDLHGNLVWMEELWQLPYCGMTESGYQGDTEKDTSNDASGKRSAGDSINILLVFNETGLERIESQLNMLGPDALETWSNVALTFLNYTLQNSGLPYRCKIKAIHQLSYSGTNVNQAYGAFSSYSGPFDVLRSLVKDSCIHIRSFIMDYQSQGPLGLGNIYRNSATDLYNVSTVNYSTFCHEVGHNLGFGHGPQANDLVGYAAASRGFNTEIAGWPGQSLSTLMDYGNRVFQFSNQVAEYRGEFSEHDGKILGSSIRDNAATLHLTYPRILQLSSTRVYLDTLICAGKDVFGYDSTGYFRDTVPDPNSCTGIQFRTLNLKVSPAIASNYSDIQSVLSFSPETDFPGQSISHFRIIQDKLLVFTANHIFLYNPQDNSFSRQFSFPDIDNGPGEDPNGSTEIILDINILDETFYVLSNHALYYLDEAEKTWTPVEGTTMPQTDGQIFMRIEEDRVEYSSDKGASWTAFNIPFEAGSSGVHLSKIRNLDSRWFVQQLQPFHLYVSEDQGQTWIRSNTSFVPYIDRLFIANDTLRIRPTNTQQWYFSTNGGLSWMADNFWGDNFDIILFDPEQQRFLAQKSNGEVYSYQYGDLEPYYVGTFEKRLNDLYQRNWITSQQQLELASYRDLAPLKLNLSICQGENSFGYSESGTYIVQTDHDNSCDSTYRLNLHVIPVDTVYMDTLLCFGQQFEGISESGEYEIIRQDTFGCDQVLNLSLDILSELGIESVVTNPTPNLGGSILIDSVWGGLAPYTYLWSDGSSGTELDDLFPGNYSLTIVDAKGCTKVFTFELSLSTSASAEFSETLRCFPNPVKASSYWQIEGLKDENYNLTVFDYWGRPVFESGPAAFYTAPHFPGIYAVKIECADKQVAFVLQVLP